MSDPYGNSGDPSRREPPRRQTGSAARGRRGAPPPRRPAGHAGRAQPPDRTQADESPTELLWLDQGVLDGSDGYETYDEHELSRDREDFDDRADPEYYDDDRRPSARARGPRRRRGKRALGWMGALGVILLLAAAAYFGGRELLGVGYEDYEGSGQQETVVEVASGDTTREIASTLADADVVASAEAFVVASKNNSDVRAIQPGYYVLNKKMSGENAAEAIVADSARVGHFQVRPGLRLSDTSMPDGSVTEGILSKLSKASCAKLNGERTCVPVQKLVEVASTADLAALGVPEWAVDAAAGAAGVRRIEGLIAPGNYNVRPGAGAEQLLRQVLEKSAKRLQAAGLPDAAEGSGYGPYEVLTIASLIQREAIEQDFAKVSRVIYNRLEQDMRLRFDSTINYVQHAPTVRTSDEERAKKGPYNTYLNTGLSPTPISAPSRAAIEAAVNPADGAWVYFVKCESNGKSCFSETYGEHQKKAADARARGVY